MYSCTSVFLFEWLLQKSNASVADIVSAINETEFSTLKKEEIIPCFKATVMLKNKLLYSYFNVLPDLLRDARTVITNLSSRFNTLADALEQYSLKMDADKWCDHFNKAKQAVDCITRFWLNRSS